MAYAQPGQVAVNSTVPFGAQGLDQATWSAGAADMLLQGIVSQARQYGGDASRVGMPATWPYGPLPTNSVHADGSLNPILVAQVQQYVNSSAAQSDPDFNSFVGVNYGTAAPGGYIDAPLSPSEQLALDKFEYDKAQKAIALATGGSTSGSSGSRSTSTSSTRSPSSSGGSSGSSSTDYGLRLGYEQQSNNLDYELAKQKQSLQLELMQKQFDLDNDPNNPKIKLERDKLAQELMMFQQSLAQKTDAEEKELQLQRAKTISDYAANPGDAVAREYFLRAQGAQPLGTPVDIFTGQAQQGQMTLSELMQKQAPLLKPYMGPQAAVPPIPAAAPPTTPPPITPPPPAPEEPVPAFAGGTNQITEDGWTRADKFITGDHPMGMPNPEMNQVRVRNGHPETKITPLSQMVGQRTPPPASQGLSQMMRGLPHFAAGSWNFSGSTGTTATLGTSTRTPRTSATTNTYGDASAGTPIPTATTSTPLSPYDANGQSQLDFSNPETNPVVTQRTSGVQYNTNQINADPYFGTSYQGMDPNAKVTNANSAYYGMTAADAFAAQQQAAFAPQLTVVGPTADIPGMYFPDGSARPYAQVNNQADAGILTGAQMSNGVTQSANPGAPGYVPPAGYPTPPNPNQLAPEIPYGNDQISRGFDLATGTQTPPEGGSAQGPTGPEPSGPSPVAAAAPTTIPGSTVQVGQPNPQGYAQVMAPGTIQFNGATYDVQAGDYQAPDGSWLRINPVTNTYTALLPSKVTQITSEAQFWALPAAEQQKVLTGQATGYAIAPWVQENLLAGYSGFNPAPLDPAGFAALTPDEQRAILEGTDSRAYTSGAYQAPQYRTTNDFGPAMGKFTNGGLMTMPQAEQTSNFRDFGQYLTPEQITALYPPPPPVQPTYVQPTPIEPTPWVPGDPNTPAPPAGTTPPPPAGTAPPPPPPAATTPPPPTGSDVTPATGTTPPPITSTSTISDIIAALSYGGDVYQNLPALQLLSGLLSQGEYDTIGNSSVDVPGLPVSLPSPNQAANYTNLSYLQQSNPDAFALLNSLYTAGNVPLSAIMAMAKSRAPLGSAFESSLIGTT